MQGKASAYIVKRLGDELFAKPAPPTDPVDAAEPEPDDLDRRMIHDEDGRRVGLALRVHRLAVYVISDGHGGAEEQFARCLDDPDHRLLFQTTDGRITGLIYAPDPNRLPPRGDALRPDEV